MERNKIISDHCNALRKDGNQCKNKQYRNSNYCYLHNLIRKSTVPWFLNPKFHISASIAGICLTIFFGMTGATIKNQRLMLKKQDSTQEKVQETDKDIKEIKNLLLADMAKIQREREDEFLKYYNLGYQLVAFDRYSNVIPYDSRIRYDYKIEWNETKLIKINSEKLELTLPSVYHSPSKGYLGKNKIVFREKFRGVIATFDGDPYKMIVEVIDYNYYGYICLIGLQNNK